MKKKPHEKQALFKDELRSLINRHSIENGSNTPDFILADYLMNCLKNYDNTISKREKMKTKKEVRRIETLLVNGYKPKHLFTSIKENIQSR